MASNGTIYNRTETVDGPWFRGGSRRGLGGYLVSLLILLCSAPPAAVIWRSSHLHRSSYYYVMLLCLLDCGVGVAVFVVTSANQAGDVGAIGCCALVNMVNMCMNAINLLMLALGRDRYLSVQYPLRYPLLVSPHKVWWHLKLAIAYGVLQGIGFFAMGYNYHQQDFCNGLRIMMAPQHRIPAFISVTSNVFLDFGTIYFNAKVIHCAWKIRTLIESDGFNPVKEAQRRRHLKMFVFTFKLAFMFLACSMPYKIAIMAHTLGMEISLSLMETLGFIRTMYHIADSWTFCFNTELLDALKSMLCG